MEEIAEFLKTREKEGLMRTLKAVVPLGRGRIRFKEKEYIDFSSNDYLGLSRHPKLITAAKKAIDEFGTGAGASRLMSGGLELHQKLEQKISAFKNKEAALFFNSGYQANVGILGALCAKGDAVFVDRLAHASILDGIVLSGARFFRFQHNDCAHSESLLGKERANFKKAFIVTETVFSMDGDKAPLKDLVSLKEKYDCLMFVDEAHATGIFGKNGSGVSEEAGLTEKIDLIMGTFSKALGSFGAYLATSKEIKEYLVNTCRSFIYSTALAPAVVAANLASIDVIKSEPRPRIKLLEMAQYFRQALQARGITVKGESQIVPIVVGENSRAVKLAQGLFDKGYWVIPVRPPTVPEHEARLRFSLTVHHDKKILEALINELASLKV